MSEKYFPASGVEIVKEYIDDQISSLSEVATSGNYADLNGTEDVATKEYVDEQIDGIEIGARNIILDSSAEIGYGWGDYDIVAYGEGIDGGNCFKCSMSELNQFKYVDQDSLYISKKLTELNLKPGDRLTLSAYIKTQDVVLGDTNPFIGFVFSYWNGQEYAFETDLDVTHIVEGTHDWSRYSITHTIRSDKDYNRANALIMLRDYTGTVWIDQIKVERGNKATDWTPAPEDTINDNLWTVLDTFQYRGITYDPSSGIYTCTNPDSRFPLNLKVDQCITTDPFNKIQDSDVQIFDVSTPKRYSLTFTKQTGCNFIRFGFNGADHDNLIEQKFDSFIDGETYTISFELIEAKAGASTFKNIKLERSSFPTKYCPSKLDDSNFLTKLASALKPYLDK